MKDLFENLRGDFNGQWIISSKTLSGRQWVHGYAIEKKFIVWHYKKRWVYLACRKWTGVSWMFLIKIGGVKYMLSLIGVKRIFLWVYLIFPFFYAFILVMVEINVPIFIFMFSINSAHHLRELKDFPKKQWDKLKVFLCRVRRITLWVYLRTTSFCLSMPMVFGSAFAHFD